MNAIIFYALLSVFLVSVTSLIGILGLSLKKERFNSIVLYLVGFSVGALLGDVFIHLLPEIVESSGEINASISGYVLLGILMSFVIEKILHWRHLHANSKVEHSPLTWMNLFGDAIHNYIDGLIIAISYLTSIPVGIASTIAIIMHEIPQEIGDFGVLIHSGLDKKKALMFNLLSGLTAVLGTITALLLSNISSQLISFLLPFAAGNFIYIAGSDLIPELHKEVGVKKSMIQFISMTAGILVMFLLLRFE